MNNQNAQINPQSIKNKVAYSLTLSIRQIAGLLRYHDGAIRQVIPQSRLELMYAMQHALDEIEASINPPVTLAPVQTVTGTETIAEYVDTTPHNEP